MSRRRRGSALNAALLTLLLPVAAQADIVTRLPTRDHVVALSFDACEAFKPMHLDQPIVDYLAERQIPYTVFMGGRFARDNAAVVRELGSRPLIEIENHSWSHNNDMPALTDERVRSEVLKAEVEIRRQTGQSTHFFRFPAGNADPRTVQLVEALGYQVVHWRWAEGDPAPQVSADDLVRETLARTRPGDILVFHINGRGVHTAEALPRIVDGLHGKGYRFVRIDAYLHPRAPSPR